MKTKYSEQQQSQIINMYHVNSYTIKKIINSVDFTISNKTIFKILKENNIPLLRRKGMKHQLIGKTFGYLNVTHMEYTKKSEKYNEWMAMCNCRCGNNNVDVRPYDLLKGNTRSCGCLKTQYLSLKGKNNPNYTGYEDISGQYWSLFKKQANKRGYLIDIDIKFMWELFIKQNKKCALSGLPLKFGLSNGKKHETTASLDRIDSKLDYLKDNVQWVHKDINFMKRSYNQDYFINLCELIANNN